VYHVGFNADILWCTVNKTFSLKISVLTLREDQKLGFHCVKENNIDYEQEKIKDWLQQVFKEGELLLLGQDFNSHERHKKYVGPCLLLGQPEVRGSDRERCFMLRCCQILRL
jgi:hypothetical protein